MGGNDSGRMGVRAGPLTSHQGGSRWWGKSHDTFCLLSEQDGHDTVDTVGGLT